MSKFTMNEFRANIAEMMERLKNGQVDPQTANAYSNLTKDMIATVKVEIEFMKATGGNGTGFIPEEIDPFDKEIPQYALEGARDCSFCKLEAVVEPDAPSVNGESACNFCLTQPTTIFFRKQLKNQKTAKELVPKLITSRITENQKEILDYLKANGGQAQVGEIGDSRHKTITRLMRLEELRLIECVKRPVYKNDFPAEKREFAPGELHCGIWKLTTAGMKAAA